MALYNLTNVTSATDFVIMTRELNNLSGGILGPGLLLTLAAIVFMALKFNTDAEVEVVFAVTLWFTVIMGFMFRAMNLVNNTFMIATIAIAVLSVGYLWVKNP